MPDTRQLGRRRLGEADVRDLLAALVAATVVRLVPRFQLEAFVSILRILLRQAEA